MRVTPEEMSRRKVHLLNTAVLLLGEQGIDRVSQNEVAAKAGVAHGNIQNYFGTYEQMKRLAVQQACVDDHIRLVAQAATHPHFSHLLCKKDFQSVVRFIKREY